MLIQQLLLFSIWLSIYFNYTIFLKKADFKLEKWLKMRFFRKQKWSYKNKQYKQREREIGHISIKFILVLTYSNPGGRYFVTWVKQSNKNLFHRKNYTRLHNHTVALITERVAVNRLSHRALAANAQKYSKCCHGKAVIKRNIIRKNYYFR